MYFQTLREQLVDAARQRVHAGELTERGLARRCGLSQPHIHHVLRSMRALSMDSADRLMRALNLSVSDLMWRVSTEPDAQVRAVAVVRNRIGPGTDAVFTVIRGHMPFPESLLIGVVDPLVARLAPDLVLPGALAAHDLVLLDQNPRIRSAPDNGSSAWVVNEGAGMRVRYLRVEGNQIDDHQEPNDARLYVADEVTRDDRRKWRAIPLHGRNILDIVRARIVWIGRKMETESTGPAGPADKSD